VKKTQVLKKFHSLTIATLMATTVNLYAHNQVEGPDDKHFFLPAAGIGRPIFSFGKLALFCGLHDLYDREGGIGYRKFTQNILKDYSGFIGDQKKFFSLIHDHEPGTTLYLFDLEKCQETKNDKKRNYSDFIKALKIERNNLPYKQTDFRYIDKEGQRIFTDIFYIYLKEPDTYQNKESIAQIGINDEQNIFMRDADLDIGLPRTFKSFTIFQPQAKNIVEFEETDIKDQMIYAIANETHLSGPKLPGPLDMGKPEIENLYWNFNIDYKRNKMKGFKRRDVDILEKTNSTELLNNLSNYFKP
jgi:hypothetical protein